MIKIIFPWIPPSKKNSKQVFCRWWRPTVIPSKAYNSWHKKMTELLSDITANKTKYKNNLTLEYIFYIPYNKDWTISKRPFDYSNKIESINDFLVDIWFIEDDNYTIIKKMYVEWKYVNFGEWKVEIYIKHS